MILQKLADKNNVKDKYLEIKMMQSRDMNNSGNDNTSSIAQIEENSDNDKQINIYESTTKQNHLGIKDK